MAVKKMVCLPHMAEGLTPSPSFKETYPTLFQDRDAQGLLEPDTIMNTLPQQIDALQSSSVFIEKQALRLACGANKEAGRRVDLALSRSTENQDRERYKDTTFDKLVATIEARIKQLTVPQDRDDLSETELRTLAEQLVEVQYLRFLASHLTVNPEAVTDSRETVQQALAAVTSWIEKKLSSLPELPSGRSLPEIAAAAAQRYVASRSSLGTLQQVVSYLSSEKPAKLSRSALTFRLESGVIQQAINAELKHSS